MNPSGDDTGPSIPDHTLLRIIGRGSYGHVWLARNVMGAYRAIKIIRRRDFKDAEPFEREIRGIRAFEPISRSHPGFINVLHLGENRDAGYFYYVMELGDDLDSGQDIQPDTYRVKTLDQWIKRDGALSPDHGLQLGLRLSDALAHLHQKGLVHRDVKPSNILYVQGVPKLADIGLVSSMQDANTLVGTIGFIPPEGPGSEQADIYGLGKVLYECLTGLDRQHFPEVPTLRGGTPQGYFELNEIILKAAHNNPGDRYPTARQMHAELAVLENGESIVRLRELERRWKRAKGALRVTAVAAVVMGIAGYWGYREYDHARSERVTAAANLHAGSVRDIDSGKFGQALLAAAQAIVRYPDDPRSEESRLRYAATLARLPSLTSLQSHQVQVNHAAILPDRNAYFAAFENGESGVFDLVTGEPLASFAPRTNAVQAAALSPDGIMAATGDISRLIRLHDTSTGQVLWEVRTDRGIGSLAFSPDGAHLLAGDYGGSVHVWSLQDKSLRAVLPLHANIVESIRFSPDGSLLATSSRDRSVCVVKGFSTNALHRFKLTETIFHVAFSPDGRRVVASCLDKAAYVWNLDGDAQTIPPLRHVRGVHHAEFSPDGRCILTAGWDGEVRFWDARSGQALSPILEHGSPVMFARFDATGRRVLTGCVDGSLRVWDRAGCRSPTYLGHAVASEDGSHVLSILSKNLRVESPGNVCTRPHLELPFAAKAAERKLSRTGHLLLTLTNVTAQSASSDLSRLEVWDTHDQRLLLARSGTISKLSNVALYEPARLLALVDQEGLEVHRLDQDQVRHVPLAEAGRATGVSFSPDGRHIAVALGTNVHLIPLEEGRASPPPLRHDGSIRCVIYSPDGRRVVTCVSDGSLDGCYARIWNADDGHALSEKLWQTDGINDAVWFEDGSRLVLVGEQGVIQFWNTDPPGLANDAFHHTDQVSDTQLDGAVLVTGSLDHSARLWDSSSTFPLSPPMLHPDGVVHVILDLPRRRLFSVERGDYAWLWPLPEETRPGALLLQLAEFLSARSSLAVPGDARERAWHQSQAWHKLREQDPRLFAVEEEDIIAWHRAESAYAMGTFNHRAELFHVECLLKWFPDDPKLLSSRNRLLKSLHKTATPDSAAGYTADP